jgi:hypothetical protein
LTIFDVDHDIDISTVPMAPFDACSLTVSTFAIENATNRIVSIVTFAAGEAPDNFVISSVEAETKSNYTYDSRAGLTTVEVQSGVIDIEAGRTRLAREFTLGLLLVNWALTIGSTYGDAECESESGTEQGGKRVWCSCWGLWVCLLVVSLAH